MINHNNLAASLASAIAYQHGGTLTLTGHPAVQKGYAVGTEGAELTVPAGPPTSSDVYVSPDLIKAWLRSYAEPAINRITADNQHPHVGAWVNQGKVYLDVSVIVDDEAEAIRLGKLWGQKAIYNLAKGEEITL